MFEIRLLGDPEFSLDGRRLRLRLLPRCLSLLAYLIYHRGQAHSRSSLAALLWPDDDEAQARANLRRHVYAMMRALPKLDPPLIENDKAVLRWNADAPVRVDIIEFDRATAPSGALADAVGLYRGELLKGTYDEWVFGPREAMRARYLTMLQSLGLTAMRRRDFEGAIDLADRLLREDEWREDAIRLKMGALYKMGDRPSALATFDRFAAELLRELNVEPMAETLAVRKAVVASVPLATLDPEIADGTNETVPTLTLPFVGRSAELERLRGLWARAARGHGAAVFVQGEAGIGKSRLTRALAAIVERQGGIVLVGGTSNPQAEPYQPVVSALRKGIAYCADAIEDTWLAALGDLLPEIHALRPQMSAPEVLEAARAEQRLTEAFARTIAGIARVKPLLLILEDVQWAGDATIALVHAIARRCGSLPVLVIATVRSGEAENRALISARQSLLQEHRATLLSLEPLKAVDLAQVTAAGSQFADVPPDVLERVATLSEGNPLFVTVMLQTYLQEGSIPNVNAAVRTLADAIDARLRGFDDSTRSIAQTGAAVGAAFSTDLLARVGGWQEAEVFRAIDALLDGGIIRETGGSPLEYAFAHALVERGLYDSMPSGDRAARHRRLAAILERGTETGSEAAVARHWLLAGERDRARDAYERAARHALAVFAWTYARDCVMHAVELCEHDADRFRLLGLVVGLQRRTGDVATWLADIDAFSELALRLGAPERRMEAALARCMFARHTGDVASRSRAIEAIEEVAKLSGSSDYEFEARSQRGYLAVDLGDDDDSVAYLRSALELLPRTSRSAADELTLRVQFGAQLARCGNHEEALEQATRARALLTPGTLADRWAVGNLESQIAFAREAYRGLAQSARAQLEIADRLGDVVAQVIAHWGIAMGSPAWPSRARSHFEIARALAETAGYHSGVRTVLCGHGYFELFLGRYDLAVDLNLRSMAMAEKDGSKTVVAHSLVNLAYAFVETGRGREALANATQAHTMLVGRTRVGDLAAALRGIGLAHLALGDRDAGLDALREAVVARRDSGKAMRIITDLVVLTDALLDASLVLEASSNAREATRLIEVHSLDWCEYPTWVCTVLARACTAAGDEAPAARWIERGKVLLAQTLERIDDEPSRATFAALAYNRRLAEGSVVDGAVQG